MQTWDVRLLARWNQLDEEDNHTQLQDYYINMENQAMNLLSVTQWQIRNNSAVILRRAKEADSQKTLLKDNIIIK